MKISEHRETALLEFRRKMAAETEALLLQQEKELGVLIGRLEVNHLFSHNAIEEYDYILSCLFSVYLDVK